MGRYETISVLREVKRELEKEKGDRDWSTFLLSLLEENRRLRRLLGFWRLRELLTDDDLGRIEEESRRFRKGFRLR